MDRRDSSRQQPTERLPRFRSNRVYDWRDEYVAPSIWYLINSNLTDPTVRPLSNYTYVNLRLSYDLPFAVGKTERPVRLNFFARNLLDERPQETLIGVDNRLAGREFFAGIEYRFGF